jgi:hypothetical protein
MIFFAALKALTLIKAVQLALLVGSIAYQRIQTRKAKRAIDAAKGFEVKMDFKSESLPVAYGLNKVGGNVVWAALRSTYVHSTINYTAGQGLLLARFADSSDDVRDAVFGPTALEAGQLLVWGGVLYRRNTTVATIPPTGLLPDTRTIISSYFILIDDDTVWYSGNIDDLIIRGLITVFGTGTSVGPLFRPTSDPRLAFTHTTLNQNISGRKMNRQEFLFMQQSICVGGIDSVITAEVDNKPVDDKEFKHGQRIDVALGTINSTNPMVLANHPSRTNAFFTNMASASMCFRLDRDKPQYSPSGPRVDFIIKGQRVRDIVPSGSNYIFSTGARIYSDNPALILADYLTSSVYGRGLPTSSIDLRSFFVAKQVCDTIVAENTTYTGYNAVARGAEKLDQTVQGTTRLYSCNILLDTGDDVWNNVQKILDTMNDSSLIWSEGKYKLQLDYPRNHAEQTALIVATLTAEDILKEPFSITYPSQDERLNQCTVRYKNGNNQLKEDTITWPKRNSAVLTSYLLQDNGVELKTDTYIEGIVDPYHAQAVAEQIVRESRYAAIVEFYSTKKALVLEPGDLVRLNLPGMGVDQVVRILEAEAVEGLGAQFKAKFFDFSVLAYNADNDLPGTQLPPPVTILDTPRNVVLTTNVVDPMIENLTGELSWTHSSSNGIDFVISIQRENDDNWRQLGTTGTNKFVIPQLSGGSYIFSVQARVTATGLLSSRGIAYYDLQGLTPPIGSSVSQLPYALRFFWQPDSDARVVGYQLHSALPVSNSNLLGRANSNFLDWPVRPNCPLCSVGGTKTVYVVSQRSDGTVSTPSAISYTIAAPTVTSLAANFQQGDIVLSWSQGQNQFAVDRYRVRATSLNVEDFVYASSYKRAVNWNGNITWQVSAIDVAGNEGPVSDTVGAVRLPAITQPTFVFDQNEIVISWQDVNNQFIVDKYKIQCPELSVDAFVYASSYRQLANWVGPANWSITPIDVTGNLGATRTLTSTVVAPSKVRNLLSKTIINNILINWDEPQTGSLPVNTYEVRQGTNPVSGRSIGFYSGTFAALFEELAGEYQYHIAAIDTAGNYGPWDSTSTLVTAPRGFNFIFSDMLALPNPNTVPINRTETWEQHFVNRGWTTLQNQVDAGFPLYAQPAVDFEDITRIIDLGTIISGFQLQLSIDKIVAESGSAVGQVFFSIRTSTSLPWTELPEGNVVFADSARYVRIRTRFSSPDNRALSTVNGLKFNALVIQKDDSGTAYVLANHAEGTEIFFTTAFIDVSSITVTVNSATIPMIAVYIFDDQPYPTSFRVKVFDLNGNRQNATVGWSANGV